MTSQKSKQDFDFMPYWRKEEECYEETKIEGKDVYTGKKVSTQWPRDKPQEQIMYESWLKKVKDETGKFFEQRDKNGNTVKGARPKYVVKKIIRIRTNDGKEWLYSYGRFHGFDVLGDPVSEHCQGRGREFWTKVSFAYTKQMDQKTMSVKQILQGPNSRETVYEVPFTPDNAKALYNLRQDDNVVFYVKDERLVRELKDPTGIVSKTFELFASKPFNYLYNSDYISPELKAQLRQRAIDEGLLPPTAQEGQRQQTAKPPTGTYT
jgi:hypothetical protein